MTTKAGCKELEDRIARTEAVNLALLLVVQTLVRRSDDYTFILRFLNCSTFPFRQSGAIYEPAEFFETTRDQSPQGKASFGRPHE